MKHKTDKQNETQNRQIDRKTNRQKDKWTEIQQIERQKG